jgi:hypothetical protein
VAEQVVIPRRFNGPPESAHGGYACAVAAELLDWSADVSLRAPPPIERPMSVERSDGAVRLLAGETIVMEARPTNVELDVPDPVTLAEAEAAAENCPWLDRHPFPTCFGCGPQRRVGDGMREFPGPVAGRPGVWATPWVPDESLADRGGEVRPIFTFSALDCPSGAGAIEAAGTSLASHVHVLGRLTGQVLEAVQVGEPHLAMAWPIRSEGRKRYGGVAIFNGTKLVAVGEALWIALEDPGQFGAAIASAKTGHAVSPNHP